MIFGFLVGFVGVVEFKVELVVNLCGCDFVVLCGWCGGLVIVLVVVNVVVVGLLEECG